MTYIDIETAEWAANLLGYRPRPQPYTEPTPAVFARPAWHAHAACRGMGHHRWFLERGASAVETVAICNGCPVRAECLQAAVDNGERTGIWGGLTQEGMRRHRKLLALRAAA